MQQALSATRTVRAPFGSAACSRGASLRLPARGPVLARADSPKVVREYREDDDKIVVPDEEGSNQPQDGSLYADQVKVCMHGSNCRPLHTHQTATNLWLPRCWCSS